jgi:hypothetical protein
MHLHRWQITLALLTALAVPNYAEDFYPINLSEMRFELLTVGVGHNMQRVSTCHLQLHDPDLRLGIGAELYRSEWSRLSQPSSTGEPNRAQQLHQFFTVEAFWGPFYATHGKFWPRFRVRETRSAAASDAIGYVTEMGVRWEIRSHIWLRVGAAQYKMSEFSNWVAHKVWPATSTRKLIIQIETNLGLGVQKPFSLSETE